MTWIESHTSLREHPKLYLLCRRLGISRAQVVGHLHLLWWWVMTYAEDGDLSRFPDEVIAGAADWPADDAERFVRGLVECGFLDRGQTGMRVHDWHEYAGRLIRERERRRRWREKYRAAPATISVADGDVSGTSQGRLRDVSGTGERRKTVHANHAHMHSATLHAAQTDDDSPRCSAQNQLDTGMAKGPDLENPQPHADFRDATGDVSGTSQGRLRDVSVRVNRNRNHVDKERETHLERTDSERGSVEGRRLGTGSSSSNADLAAEVLFAWNEICAGENGGSPPLPPAYGWTRSRRARLAARVRDLRTVFGERVETAAWWRELFARVRASPFLRGESESGWQASLDWLLEDAERILRVMEGRYDPRTAAPPANSTPAPSSHNALPPELAAQLEQIRKRIVGGDS